MKKRSKMDDMDYHVAMYHDAYWLFNGTCLTGNRVKLSQNDFQKEK